MATVPAAAAAPDVRAIVADAVHDTAAVDLHTHLFPPSHGALFLFGIDELLTYHYLIAEVSSVLPLHAAADTRRGIAVEYPVTPDALLALDKRSQADVVWQHLFVRRTPLSEACRGVLTTLGKLGLRDVITSRDLSAARAWFAAQDPSGYVDHVLDCAGVRYVVMTNVPFDDKEAACWCPPDGSGVPRAAHPRMKAALRVDPLLAGDWGRVAATLSRDGLPLTAGGLEALLLKFIDVMEPVYLMASTPADFLSVEQVEACAGADGVEADPPGPLSAATMVAVLMSVAQRTGLGLAVKVGAVRGMNPSLAAGGDGVQVAGLAWLAALCRCFPDVQFLVTVLSRDNQHELAVLGSKFPNLHVYGCWWYCNNPSIITETTRMRLELLGTSFTAQHSDARVLDQLPYKWAHFRQCLVEDLVEMYTRTTSTGWAVSADDVRRDVRQLMGGAFEDFLGLSHGTAK